MLEGILLGLPVMAARYHSVIASGDTVIDAA